MRLLSLFILSLLLAACQEGRPPAGSGPIASPDTSGVSDADTASASDTGRPGRQGRLKRPATILDTIRIESQRRRVELTLYDVAIFTTYFPANEMLVRESSSGEGIGVLFIANFGGTRNDDAFLQIFVPADPAADYLDMRELLVGAQGIAQSNGWRLGTPRADGPRPCIGAIRSWPITGPAAKAQIGFACIGEHSGRGFIVLGLYPREYEEGMGPRIDRILGHFRWQDNGAPLFDGTSDDSRP